MGTIIQRVNANQVHLVADLFNQYRVFYKKDADLPLAEKFLTERLSQNESVVFVALEANTPAGFTQLYPTYSSARACKNWILNDLFVHADYRKKGIGEKLIRAAMNFAKQDGATYVQLSTAFDNKTAQNLYEAIGFERFDPEAGFYTYKIPV